MTVKFVALVVLCGTSLACSSLTKEHEPTTPASKTESTASASAAPHHEGSPKGSNDVDTVSDRRGRPSREKELEREREYRWTDEDQRRLLEQLYGNEKQSESEDKRTQQKTRATVKRIFKEWLKEARDQGNSKAADAIQKELDEL